MLANSRASFAGLIPYQFILAYFLLYQSHLKLGLACDMFSVNGNQHYTRNKTKYFETMTNTKRYFNSPLNYLTRLLNSS